MFYGQSKIVCSPGPQHNFFKEKSRKTKKKKAVNESLVAYQGMRFCNRPTFKKKRA